MLFISIIIGIGKFLGWLLGAILFSIWWHQGKLLYMPNVDKRDDDKLSPQFNEPGYRNPGEHPYNLPYEEHTITTRDGVQLHTWLVLQKDSAQCPTLLFFHGNAGNIGHRLHNARGFYHQSGCNILLIDYRGYGGSQLATISEAGLTEDALACLEFARSCEKLDPKRLFAFGQSLGGAVVAALASLKPEYICGVIVENSFTSILDMAIVMGRMLGLKKGHALLRFYLWFFLLNHWPSLTRWRSIQLPVLFISSLKDEIVPPAHMAALHDAAVRTSSKQLYSVANGKHNDTFIKGGAEYHAMFAQFFAACSPAAV